MHIFASKAQSIKEFFDIVNQELSDDKDQPPLITREFIYLKEADIKYLSSIDKIDNEAKEIIQNVSNKFHEYYELKKGAKNNLLETLPKKSATVIYTPILEGYSGISFMSQNDNNFYIFISSQDHYCKQTFTLLHEIGHVIFCNVNNPELIEDIINYFVNITLLPPSDVMDQFADFSESKLADYKDLFTITSKKYEVSYKAILYSLYHIGKIDAMDNISEVIDELMFKHFDTDSAVDKVPYRYNPYIHAYLKELLDKNIIDIAYVREMNNVAPVIA